MFSRQSGLAGLEDTWTITHNQYVDNKCFVSFLEQFLATADWHWVESFPLLHPRIFGLEISQEAPSTSARVEMWCNFNLEWAFPLKMNRCFISFHSLCHVGINKKEQLKTEVEQRPVGTPALGNPTSKSRHCSFHIFDDKSVLVLRSTVGTGYSHRCTNHRVASLHLFSNNMLFNKKKKKEMMKNTTNERTRCGTMRHFVWISVSIHFKLLDEKLLLIQFSKQGTRLYWRYAETLVRLQRIIFSYGKRKVLKMNCPMLNSHQLYLVWDHWTVQRYCINCWHTF